LCGAGVGAGVVSGAGAVIKNPAPAPALHPRKNLIKTSYSPLQELSKNIL